MKHTNTLIAIMLLFAYSTYAQITYERAFPNINFEFTSEIQNANDGSNRLFVVEQRGRIKAFPNRATVSANEVSTFLDITNRVFFSNGQEIGLLGLAFHPEFTFNGHFYVYFTTRSPAPGISVRMVLSRFTVNPANPNSVDPNTEQVIFQFDKNQNNSNHNGGKIAFGPDGYLYVSIGDGGGGNDPRRNSQNKDNVFGSILRIDVDVDGNNPIETNPIAPNGNYEIPSDNPFVNADGLDEIFAYGIRNTWKFSFDTTNGRLWGADVGQNAFEEINIIENGNNYGWNRFEGNAVANSGVSITGDVTAPTFVYSQNRGDKSITGGYVYRGSTITSLSPDINGKYIFGDFLTGRVWALDYNPITQDASSQLLFRITNSNISSFGLDENDELYFSDYGFNAELYRIVDGSSAPTGTAVNGIGQWSDLNQGIRNGVVNAIVTASDGTIYHAGTFNQAGNVAANNIASWTTEDGWQALDTSGSNGAINALALAPNGNLYAGGSFTQIGGIAANNIAVWNGIAWSALSTGVDGAVAALAVDGNSDLFVGGVFETAAGTTVRNIASWNGSRWNALTDANTAIAGTNNEIRSLSIDTDGILYVGGNFDEVGNRTANRIATWNGSNWGTLGSGTSGFVEAITTTPTEVYIGGNFAIAGGQTVNRIARWNKQTTSWSSLDDGVSNGVNALLHDGTYVYAAGTFKVANNDQNNRSIVNNVARWSANEGWQALGTNTDVGVDIRVNALQFGSGTNGRNTVYAGGNFSTAGTVDVNNTAFWTLNANFLSTSDSNGETVLYYPNPTAGDIILPSIKEWKLYDAAGRLLTEGNSKVVDMSTFKDALYFLKLENATTLKIIRK